MTTEQMTFWKEVGAAAAIAFIAFMQQWNARRAKKERRANATVVEKVHTLVNSQMGATLNVARLATKRTAEVTKHPSDLAVAEEAERAYQEHQKKQATVDAKPTGETSD
jgi:hypothetical protein